MRESSTSALAEALRCEEIAAACPPGDPARNVFRRESEWWLNEAAKREADGR